MTICRILKKISNYEVIDIFQNYFLNEIDRFYNNISLIDVNVSILIHDFNKIFAYVKKIIINNVKFDYLIDFFKSFFSHLDDIWWIIQNLLFKESISELATTSTIIKGFERDESIQDYVLNSIKIYNIFMEAKFAQLNNLGQEGCRNRIKRGSDDDE